MKDAHAGGVALEAGADERAVLENAVRLGGSEVVPLARARGLIWASDDHEALRAALHPGIEWVQLWSTGIEDWFSAGIIDDRRRWTAAQGVHAPVIAEYVLTMLLAATRRLTELVRVEEWRRSEVRTLRGKTVGIVGAGGIGTAVIALLRPIGVRTIALTRTGRIVPGADESLGMDGIDHVIAETDFIVLSAPDTCLTRGLIDRPRLERMRAEAWVVNVGRGTIIDTDALVAALRDNRIGGAALDVTDPEPLPAGHPLWTLPNAIVSCHTACTPELARAAFAERVRENVSRFRTGDRLLGAVDPAAGY